MTAWAYDAATARVLADVCGAIHGNEAPALAATPVPACPELPDLAFRQAFRDQDLVRTSFAAAYSCRHGPVVAFRGTEPTVADWLRNFAAILVPDGRRGGAGGTSRVALGFLHEYLEIEGALVAHLLASDPSKRTPIVLCGHSQGGAVATIACARLEAEGFDVAAVYTFEAPRPGDGAFAASLSAPVYRIEYGHDVVPHVPPNARLAGNRDRMFTAVIDGFRRLATAAGLPTAVAKTMRSVAVLLEEARKGIAGVLAHGLAHVGIAVPTVEMEGLPALIAGKLAATPEAVPEDVYPLVRLLCWMLEPLRFESVGRLHYLRDDGTEVRFPSAKQEEDLHYERLSALLALAAPDRPRLFDDHAIGAWRDRLR